MRYKLLETKNRYLFIDGLKVIQNITKLSLLFIFCIYLLHLSFVFIFRLLIIDISSKILFLQFLFKLLISDFLYRLLILSFLQ